MVNYRTDVAAEHNHIWKLHPITQLLSEVDVQFQIKIFIKTLKCMHANNFKFRGNTSRKGQSSWQYLYKQEEACWSFDILLYLQHAVVNRFQVPFKKNRDAQTETRRQNAKRHVYSSPAPLMWSSISRVCHQSSNTQNLWYWHTVFQGVMQLFLSLITHRYSLTNDCLKTTI